MTSTTSTTTLPIDIWAARHGYDPNQVTTAAKFTAWVLDYAKRIGRDDITRTNIPTWLPEAAVAALDEEGQ